MSQWGVNVNEGQRQAFDQARRQQWQQNFEQRYYQHRAYRPERQFPGHILCETAFLVDGTTHQTYLMDAWR